MAYLRTRNGPMVSALLSLIPSSHYNAATIPEDLIADAITIQAVTKDQAPNLKPDEEIARNYACAHMAIEGYPERSKTTMYEVREALDIGELGVIVRPPCGPKVYTKLKIRFEHFIPKPSEQHRKATLAMKRKDAPSAGVSTPKRFQGKKPVGASEVPSTLRPGQGKGIIREAKSDLPTALMTDAVDDNSHDTVDISENTEIDLNKESLRVSRATRGTLCHPGVDWLSKQRQSQYREWKVRILREMDKG